MPEELNIDKYIILTLDEIKEIKDNLIAHNIPLFRIDKENNIYYSISYRAIKPHCR